MNTLTLSDHQVTCLMQVLKLHLLNRKCYEGFAHTLLTQMQQEFATLEIKLK